MIIFAIHQLIVYSVKCQKNVENAHLNFPEPNVMFSNSFVCPNNSPKHKESFFFKNDTKKQQLLTFKTLNQQFFLLFYMKNDRNNYLIIKIVGN